MLLNSDSNSDCLGSAVKSSSGGGGVNKTLVVSYSRILGIVSLTTKISVVAAVVGLALIALIIGVVFVIRKKKRNQKRWSNFAAY